VYSKEALLKTLKKESATTLKVLKAYPADKNDFKPHERSSDIKKLASTFVFEMYLLEMYLFGDPLDRSKFQTYKPENVHLAAADFEQESAGVIARFEQMDETDLNKTVSFAGHTFVADEFAMMMIHDQIHHRGQMTVYLRMAGGKVPSVYGPSADDASPNF
jgi:uncharacterized damage-inducible protein DinB